MSLVSAFFAFLLAILSFASNAEACSRNVQSLPGKWEELRKDEFIVQYAVEGEHVLHDFTDTKGDGVPDIVSDATTQLIVMRDMLVLLGFQLPLASDRYKSQGVDRILVRFRELDRLNGRAFDEVRRLSSGECVIIIELGTRYKSGNLTPAHELFHQVQNGYTPFKRPWFYEGTARWSETVLGAPLSTPASLPNSDASRDAVWSQSYAAVSTWYGLIEKCEQHLTSVSVPDSLRSVYYRSGRPVLVDELIPGHRYIRYVLEQLGQLGNRVTQESGLVQHRWPESVQRDTSHDSDIWSSLGDACRRVSG